MKNCICELDPNSADTGHQHNCPARKTRKEKHVPMYKGGTHTYNCLNDGNSGRCNCEAQAKRETTAGSFTPGPWRQVDDSGFIVISRDGDEMADDVKRANARLIAAAPELLMFIKMLVAGVEDPKTITRNEDELLSEAKALIAKAEASSSTQGGK